MQNKPYIKGYPDNTIRPDGKITRAEAAAMLANIMGLEIPEDAVVSYSDISEKHWAYDAVQAVTKAGIFTGYKDGSFAPDKGITRAEFVAAIANALKLKIQGPYKANYPDTEGHWALGMIEEIHTRKFIASYEDGTFRPENKIKRCEAVVILNKMLNRGNLKSDKSPFVDLKPDHWAFGDMLAAAMQID